MTNFYNMNVIRENYKDFIAFVLSQPPERHVGHYKWMESEVGDYIREKGFNYSDFFDYTEEPIGIFGPIAEERGVYYSMSQYGSEAMGGWCDITSELDEYNYLCYGHLQKFIKDNDLYELKPCKY